MTTIAVASGKKIRIEQIALAHFLANGTDTEIYYRNGTNETLTTDSAAILSALDGFFNYNGIAGAGPDSTYIHTRVNSTAVLSAVPTGASAVTSVIEGFGTLVLDRGDAELVSSLMNIIS